MDEIGYNSDKTWTYKHRGERVSVEGKKPLWNGRPLGRSHDTTAPDPDLPFIVSTDASGVGIGAVLEQKQGDHVKPIAYYSRKLADRETRYGITELEALAVHQAMRHFAVYLLSSKAMIYTDHKAHTFLKTMKNSSPQVARWWVELQQYALPSCDGYPHTPPSSNTCLIPSVSRPSVPSSVPPHSTQYLSSLAVPRSLTRSYCQGSGSHMQGEGGQLSQDVSIHCIAHQTNIIFFV